MRESTTEIAYSKKFICPNQEAVDTLRDPTKESFLGKERIEDFTILRVPDRVARILSEVSYETYAGVLKGEITTLEIVRSAMICAGHIGTLPVESKVIDAATLTILTSA